MNNFFRRLKHIILSHKRSIYCKCPDCGAWCCNFPNDSVCMCGCKDMIEYYPCGKPNNLRKVGSDMKEKLKITYKIKNYLDNELERDIKKIAEKHKFVFLGSGFNNITEERDYNFERITN